MQRSFTPGRAMVASYVALLTLTAHAAAAAPMIVEAGQPRAQIVIADDPPRLVKVAADELQRHIEKISGATLPIVTEPTGAQPVTIYVGQSKHTDQLGITDEGLRHGAYRMVSGPDYLVLLGEDFDFVPKEPWPRSANDHDRAQKAWENASGSTFQIPMIRLYKDYNQEFDIWFHDRGGSLHAVYAFLRTLGARWYMPGELGEVLPQMSDISLPSVDTVDTPDFPIRRFKWVNYNAGNWDEIIWERRLGLSTGVDVAGASPIRSHGLRNVMDNEQMRKAHPEYYAMRGGQRDMQKNGYGVPCLSAQGLVYETARYVRTVYAIYDEPFVSIWPTDGLRKCACDKCAPHELTELVWQFVDRVAREVYKTHPDRLIGSGAYAQYVGPPKTVDKFSPNLVVCIANRGRPWFAQDLKDSAYPDKWGNYVEVVEGYAAKLAPQRIRRGENNRWTLKDMGQDASKGGKMSFPIHCPHSYAKDMAFLKGRSLGERSELPRGRNPYAWRAIGNDHLNLYVHGRTLWDADLDMDALLEEYYTLFYGPVRDQMKAAFEFAYQHVYSADKAPLDLRLKYVNMLHAAHAAAGDSVYAKRIALMLSELQSRESIQEEIRLKADTPDARDLAPVVTLPSETHDMRDIKTGKLTAIKTTWSAKWEGDAMVFDFRCEDPDMDNLLAAHNVWSGDSVAILLETPDAAGYYQIEINPDGKVFDAHRRPGGLYKTWSSGAEVDAHRADDHWRVTVRLPIVSAADGEGDPNHYVVGNKPTADAPWFFNVGRARVRLGDDDKQAYAFIPTGDGGYHVPEKFAKLQLP